MAPHFTFHNYHHGSIRCCSFPFPRHAAQLFPINAEREDSSWKWCFGGQGPDPAPGTAELRPPHRKSQHWSDAVLSASNDNPQGPPQALKSQWGHPEPTWGSTRSHVVDPGLLWSTAVSSPCSHSLGASDTQRGEGLAARPLSTRAKPEENGPFV